MNGGPTESVSYLDDLFSLTGRVAVVTGGARGNGLAMADALRGAGAEVIVFDKLNGDDVTSEAARRRIFSGLRRLDVLVNNAGIALPGTSSFDWDRTYEVNLRAPFELCKLAAEKMIEQRSGSIINITSICAELAQPNNPAYISSKGGLRQLTRALALDIGPYGIRCNCIAPGYIDTDMTRADWSDKNREKARTERTMLKRLGEPKDLAGAVVFLASDASSYMTGQDIVVDGGWSVKGL
jgi:NAD(P)-dependent dehydrogenase (short-subunit alcohol dehydrogenase family)